jgi:hypothetical protein
MEKGMFVDSNPLHYGRIILFVGLIGVVEAPGFGQSACQIYFRWSIERDEVQALQMTKGRSFMVSSPGSASMTRWAALTTMAAVAMSP